MERMVFRASISSVLHPRMLLAAPYVLLKFTGKFFMSVAGIEVIKVVMPVVYSRSVIYAVTLVVWCLH
jgi:hypothetical protein